MALLADEQRKKDLSERLEEFSQFGMIFNYMLDIEKVSIDDLDKMFFSSDRDKASIMYTKILKSMKGEYLEKAYTIYSHEYPNELNYESEIYNSYLNKCCINNIISRIADNKKNSGMDRTYLNTYTYLLDKAEVNYARK